MKPGCSTKSLFECASAPDPHLIPGETMIRPARRGEGKMWTKAHRARHDARLKEVVWMHAVGQVARWLERADPPGSARATP